MTPRKENNKDHEFVPRMGEMGMPELHDCIKFDHGPVAVCDICGGDYHRYEEEHAVCPLGK